MYASWISGYSYDDAGNLKTDENGEWTETDEPHWIDHIPVGEYVLEETECPYEQGYVQKKRENIQILETENVQSFTMEDDFTSVEIRKEDGKTGELLYEDSLAKLTLYQADRKTLKFLADSGYAVLNLENELVTAVPQKWRKKYDKYLKKEV